MFLNILVTSPSAQTCARNLDNWLLEQQIYTVACLLSAYAKICSYSYNQLWEQVPEQHPWLRWMRNEAANMDWVMDYGVMLLVEYGVRTGRKHQGAKHIYSFIEDFGAPVGMEPMAFINRAFDETYDFRYTTDVHLGYRHYVNALWAVERKKLSWGDRMPPTWFIEYQLTRQGKELQGESDPTDEGTGYCGMLSRVPWVSEGCGSNPGRDL